ncbi:protein SMAX1-LIKE 3-like [Typha latifolia]|uniref:protein SMAX1-LIKE 3-like n=1 Tax=Typha latifolia TaxID=4733 RepID=UPI003C2AACEF
MRAGGWMVQQALTPEAASVVKQAVALAKQRGHAQVTPLHVANTMLSSSAGLLRTACLQSRSHPLQCKALELCFNVALNRLPASSSSGSLMGPHHAYHHFPSLSNALVAAFKRAQAHQRRGSIESQQQPLLAVKVELEQLVISILDDPSVSRVMREAGFSSTQVKSNVEQVVSSQTCVPTHESKNRPSDQVKSEDVKIVLETLMSGKNRSLVVVGECLATSEGFVGELMDRFKKGEVPVALRSLQFMSLSLSSLEKLSREEVESKIGELRCLVKSSCIGKGAVLYLGDLNLAAEDRASCGDKGRSMYCPLEHFIMELGSLVCDGTEGDNGQGNIWLMGIATYKTFMRCKVGQPSLETLWGLQPIILPAASLELSLSHDSGLQRQWRSKTLDVGSCWHSPKDGIGNGQLICLADCSVKFENDGRGLGNINNGSDGSILSRFPPWLQQYKEDNLVQNDQNDLQFKDLYKNWHSACSEAQQYKHQPPSKSLNFSPSFSISSNHWYHSILDQIPRARALPVNMKHFWTEQHCSVSKGFVKEPESNFGLLQTNEGQGLSPLCSANPNAISSTSSSTDSIALEYDSKFKEMNSENLKTFCNALEDKVPCHKDIIPEIASTILRCRSGMRRRKEKVELTSTKEETWLLFLGCNVEAKEKIAKELANLVFSSYTNFTSIGLSTYSSMRPDTDNDRVYKRPRSEASHTYLERFIEAIHNNPHRVILMEDIDQVDYNSLLGIKNATEKGKIESSIGEEVGVSDAIIILSCESFTKRSLETDEENQKECEKETESSVHFDLNLSADNMEDGWSSGDVDIVDMVDRTFLFK